LVLPPLGRPYCGRDRSKRSPRFLRTIHNRNRSSLGHGHRMGWNRLLDKRTILRQGPLQNRRNPLSSSSHFRRAECAVGLLIRLEPVLARLHRDSGRKLRPRMGMEKIRLNFLRGQVAAIETVANETNVLTVKTYLRACRSVPE